MIIHGINIKERYILSVSERYTCKNCGNIVFMLDAGAWDKKNKHNDYAWVCSNINCDNSSGECCGDMEDPDWIIINSEKE